MSDWITRNDWGAHAFGHRVVARFRDGLVIKGVSRDFVQGRSSIGVLEQGTDGDEPTSIHLRNLKALFFVKSLDGDRHRLDSVSFNSEQSIGRRTIVFFEDGEVLTGHTVSYDPERQGFFLIPADARSNNSRVYVVNDAVRSVHFV